MKNIQHYFKRFNNFYFDYISSLECLPIFHFKNDYTDYILKKIYIAKPTKNYPQGTYEFICRKGNDDNYILQFHFNDDFLMCSSFDKIDEIRFTDKHFEKFREFLQFEQFREFLQSTEVARAMPAHDPTDLESPSALGRVERDFVSQENKIANSKL